MEIPKDYIEFLYWLKEKTETHWKNKTFEVFDHDNLSFNDNWLIGAKWVGLDENEIASIESTYNVKFTPAHKEFLKILHTVDRKEQIHYIDENDKACVTEEPFFYNWLTDEKYIRDYLEFPREILEEIIERDNFLSESRWGKSKPDVASKLLEKAPKLVPISGHQFVTSTILDNQNPVLSFLGADTAIIGSSVRNYLLFKLSEYINFTELYYDEEDLCWHSTDLQKEYENDHSLCQVMKIPFWQDFI